MNFPTHKTQSPKREAVKRGTMVAARNMPCGFCGAVRSAAKSTVKTVVKVLTGK